MMARVPTWTELRMDAEKLEQLQRECYYSVHKLLDSDIPELDRKISSLNNTSSNGHHLHVTVSAKSPDVVPPPILEEETPYFEPLRNNWKQEVAPIRNSKSLESVQAKNFKYPQTTLIRNHRNPSVVPVKLAKSPEGVPIRNILTPDIIPVTSHKVQESRKAPTRNKKIPEVIHQIHYKEPNINELEHLQPLPLPLSYYFQKNRPELVLRVNSRVMYLRNKSERRKQLASTRIINSLEKIRLSSRSSSNYQLQQTRKDYVAPKYQVQCKLSEHEMKRLTAKTYKRLPEVKRRRKEEFSNHMKVQNYKNKLEYGRKLLENRRHGIINYPLRSSCDDRSITSSQSDFF